MLNLRPGWRSKEQVFAVRLRGVHSRQGREGRKAEGGGARQQHVELDAGTYVVGTCPRPSIHPHTPTYICTHIHLYPPCSWATPAPVTHRAHRSKQLTSTSEAHANARGTSTSTSMTDEQWRRERQPASQPADPVQVCEGKDNY
ncbi:hypothetical protein COCVIDRAFT_33415 [Bipolaris victoriae FI3]|uniref:Uncharacterized protein n=1 Tax=Bipolaris victoriae (strain FI3) TaxID=930091 RepID=W7EZ63_BIPV3|nr:hypothetical protein COCVIDRAFT_33415 [Bipolaris victoriae FI3]